MKQVNLFFALLVLAAGCTSENEGPHDIFPQLQSLTAENLGLTPIPQGDTTAIDVMITGIVTNESAPLQEAWIVWENNPYSTSDDLTSRGDYNNKTPVDIIDKNSFEARLEGVKKSMLLTVYFKTNAGYNYSAVYGYNTAAKKMQIQSAPIKSD